MSASGERNGMNDAAIWACVFSWAVRACGSCRESADAASEGALLLLLLFVLDRFEVVPSCSCSSAGLLASSGSASPVREAFRLTLEAEDEEEVDGGSGEIEGGSDVPRGMSGMGSVSGRPSVSRTCKCAFRHSLQRLACGAIMVKR